MRSTFCDSSFGTTDSIERFNILSTALSSTAYTKVSPIPSSNCFPLVLAAQSRAEGNMTDTHNEGKIRLARHSDAYWRVTLDLPPLNIFGPANLPQLEEVVSSLESDDKVKVVVFDS